MHFAINQIISTLFHATLHQTLARAPNGIVAVRSTTTTGIRNNDSGAKQKPFIVCAHTISRTDVHTRANAFTKSRTKCGRDGEPIFTHSRDGAEWATRPQNKHTACCCGAARTLTARGRACERMHFCSSWMGSKQTNLFYSISQQDTACCVCVRLASHSQCLACTQPPQSSDSLRYTTQHSGESRTEIYALCAHFGCPSPLSPHTNNDDNYDCCSRRNRVKYGASRES